MGVKTKAQHRNRSRRDYIIELNRLRLELDVMRIAIEILGAYARDTRTVWLEQRLQRLKSVVQGCEERVAWLRDVLINGKME